MNTWTLTTWMTAFLLIGLASAAFADDAAGSAPRAINNLRLSTNGSTLSGAEGGVGGAIGWLRNAPDSVIGLGAEHQSIADSQWTFGSLTGSFSRGQGSSRWTVYGEVHQGTGDENGRDFDYAVYAAGLVRSLTNRLSVQLEDRHIDIDNSSGNLPKLGVTYLLRPHMLAAVSYSKSVSGNLGTELGTTRIDYFGKHFNFLIGGAGGRASAAVVNLQTGIEEPGRTLREGFLGFSKAFGRAEWMLIGDYLELGESERATLTLSCTLRLGAGPAK